MRTSFIIFLVMVVGTLLSLGDLYAQARKTNWEAFSKNLVKGIQEGNEGVQQAAMRNIILYNQLYPGKLQVDEAAWDIVRIFRVNKNQRVRQLAMVTISSIGHDWAMYYLIGNLKYEKNKCIGKQCCCIIKNYYAQKEKQKQEKEAKLLADSEK